VAIPVDEQVRHSLGAQHDPNESMTPGMSFAYVNLGGSDARNPTVRADLENDDLFVLGTVAFEPLPRSRTIGLGRAGS
jgi:hypothetical protein